MFRTSIRIRVTSAVLGLAAGGILVVTPAAVADPVIIPTNPPIPGCPIGYTNIIVGTPGADEIYGTDESDLILGYGGDDYLMGGRGRDIIVGGNGDDDLSGLEGNDCIVGGAGDDESFRYEYVADGDDTEYSVTARYEY